MLGGYVVTFSIDRYSRKPRVLPQIALCHREGKRSDGIAAIDKAFLKEMNQIIAPTPYGANHRCVKEGLNNCCDRAGVFALPRTRRTGRSWREENT